MKRLALALATSLLASGCIYLTPPTGLRIGSHDNEFASTGATGSAIAMSQYKTSDFLVIFPDIWSVIPPENLVSQRDGKTIKRVSIGQIASNGDAEGLQITNLLAQMDPDPGKNLTALGGTVLASLKAGVKDDYKVVANEPITMGGDPGLRIEVTGTGLDEADPTTGQTFAGKPQHYLAYCCWHKGRAYILVISTLETRWTQLSQLFEGMAKEFRFQDGAAPAVCTTQVTPSPRASAAASADPNGTPAASPTPQTVYFACNPDAAASQAAQADKGATSPVSPVDAGATDAASPAPSASPTPAK